MRHWVIYGIPWQHEHKVCRSGSVNIGGNGRSRCIRTTAYAPDRKQRGSVMGNINPKSAYFSILSVIQPASIEEVENSVSSLLGDEHLNGLVRRGQLKKVHQKAIRDREVIKVSGRKYFISQWARTNADEEILSRSISNERFFLIKSRRKNK